MNKNKIKLSIAAASVTLLTSAAWGAPLTSWALKVIPADAHQIISVDYGTARKSTSAMALKAQVLPNDLKTFETALENIGINPDRDLDSLTFVLVGNEKDDFAMVAMASGSFSSRIVLRQPQMQKERPVKNYDSDVYSMTRKPVPAGSISSDIKPRPMKITFLSDNTILFGDGGALSAALNARGGYAPTVDSNRNVMDQILSVEEAPVWSVLDQQGSRHMLLAAMGDDANKLVAYQEIKNMVLSSRYIVDFKEGVKLDLHILTQDSTTSAALSSLLKAGVLYKKVTATPAQRVALDNMTVSTEHSDLQMQFKADPKQFQNLLRTKFFTALSGERKAESSGGTTALLAMPAR